MKIYMVETISLFRHTHFIKAKNEVDALDEFYYRKDDDSFVEGSQKYLDEIHSNVRELSEEEFLKVFDKENEYLQDWSDEQKFQFINQIEYVS